MNTRHHHSLIALGACMALTLCAGFGRAADAPAPEASPAVEAPAIQAPTAEKPRVFSMRIGGNEEDGTSERGIVIRVEGDEGESAVGVVDRVVGELEQALAGLPEEARQEVDEQAMRELREALGEIRALREPGHVVVDASDREVDPWAEAISAIVPVMVLFLGPVLIVAIVSYNSRRKREMVHQTIDRIIAQGHEVPIELLDALDKGKSNGRSGLSRGTVNVALGVGIGAALFTLSGPDVATLGLIPLVAAPAERGAARRGALRAPARASETAAAARRLTGGIQR